MMLSRWASSDWVTVCLAMHRYTTPAVGSTSDSVLDKSEIKIDKSFVCNIPGVIKDETIVRAIITMGLGLNLNVIAEGVETERQRKFLEAQGCQEFQGYLFSRPLPLADLETYLKCA